MNRYNRRQCFVLYHVGASTPAYTVMEIAGSVLIVEKSGREPGGIVMWEPEVYLCVRIPCLVYSV